MLDRRPSRHRPVPPEVMSRADFLLLHRSASDISRLPLFGLVMLVCGEFTPLVVPFLSGVVPQTCRIPRQAAADRRRVEQRRAASFRSLRGASAAAAANGVLPPDEGSAGPAAGAAEKRLVAVPADSDAPPLPFSLAKGDEGYLDALGHAQLLHISRSLGLHSARLWLDGKPERPQRLLPRPPRALLQYRVRKHRAYLMTDDILLVRDGGVDALAADELEMALVDRGLNTLGLTDEQRRRLLRRWLTLTQKHGLSIFPLLLAR
jgi:hypothetical protein